MVECRYTASDTTRYRYSKNACMPCVSIAMKSPITLTAEHRTRRTSPASTGRRLPANPHIEFVPHPLDLRYSHDGDLGQLLEVEAEYSPAEDDAPA